MHKQWVMADNRWLIAGLQGNALKSTTWHNPGKDINIMHIHTRRNTRIQQLQKQNGALL
jgi:hypothetical protein